MSSSSGAFATWLAAVRFLTVMAALATQPLSARAEDARCDALAALQRFTVISTKETDRRDLYLGADVTVGTTDVAGTCSLTRGTCDCPKLQCAAAGEVCTADSDCPDGSCSAGVCACAAVSCAIGGKRCIGDEDCLVAAPGTCDAETHSCACPERAAGCLARGRQCASDGDCRAAATLGRSTGGACGNDMLITSGNRIGIIASRGDVNFGSSLPNCRQLRIESEFANTPNGRVVMPLHAPVVGPAARISDNSSTCGCDDGCGGGGRLTVGPGRHLFSSSDGQTRRGLAGTGSSLNFKLCDAALTLLESTGSDRQYGASPFQRTIEGYVPLARERVVLGANNCLACARVTTADRACSACAATDLVRTRKRTQKIVIILGGGLQVLDLPRVALQGNTVFELRGQRDTVALVRVAKDIHLGGEAKVVLESNGTGKGTLQVDKVLWVAMGGKGGRPNMARASTFRGTLLASGRAGIRIGGAVLVEGALWSRKVTVSADSTVQHYPFSELLPLPGSSSEIFAPVGSALSQCVDTIS